MTARERTRQQLDPIGTLGNSLATIFFTVAAFVMAAGMVARRLDGVSNPPLGVVALLLFGLSCTILVLSSNPIRAPFSRRSLSMIVALAVGAGGLDLASVWADDRFLWSGWAPVSLGLLLLAMGPYRPARELVAAGSLAAVFIGFLTVVHNRVTGPDVPVLAIVAVTVMPVLAFAYATAAHSREVVVALERWQRKVLRPGRFVSRDDEDGIARSVQQDRVTILNREVLPFFLEMIEKPAVSNGDRERARDIAASFRRVMVAEVDRSWLEHALDQLSAAADAVSSPEVLDDDHIANVMSYDQRTALRAFITALFDLSRSDDDFLKIQLFRDGQLCRGVIVVELEMADHALRSRFAPYFAVLRVMFPDLRLEYFGGVLTLSFSYEQR
jgi:hypothetical protein